VFNGELAAAELLPQWTELWPWIRRPAPAIALFGVHQLLAHVWGEIARSEPRVPRISSVLRGLANIASPIPEKRSDNIGEILLFFPQNWP
jgi:hypothetical protein